MYVYRESSGEVKHLLEITQRFTKANADLSENTTYVRAPCLLLPYPADIPRTRMVMTSHEILMLDPTVFALALAFADNAFKGISLVE